jgi:hypothetical protein
MLNIDNDASSDDDDYLFDIANQAIYRQWRTERWLMATLLWPAKAPRPHPIDKLTWIAGSHTALAAILDALEQDGLIQRDGKTVSATKAAISFWRLELTQKAPL